MLDSPQDLPGVPMETRVVADSEGNGVESGGHRPADGPVKGEVVEMDVSPTGGHLVIGLEKKNVNGLDISEEREGSYVASAFTPEDQELPAGRASASFAPDSGETAGGTAVTTPATVHRSEAENTHASRGSSADAHPPAERPGHGAGQGLLGPSWGARPLQSAGADGGADRREDSPGRKEGNSTLIVEASTSINMGRHTISRGMETEAPRPWWRDRKKLENRLFKARILVALLAVFGTCMAGLVTQELPAQHYDPRGGEVQNAKRVEVITAFLLILALYYLHYLMCIWDVLSEHLKGKPWPTQDRSLTAPFLRRSFWIEVFVCIWHNPPNLTFEWGYYNQNFFVAYRSESILSVISSLRFYTLWRVLRDFYLRDLPNRHTISTMVQVCRAHPQPLWLLLLPLLPSCLSHF